MGLLGAIGNRCLLAILKSKKLAIFYISRIFGKSMKIQHIYSRSFSFSWGNHGFRSVPSAPRATTVKVTLDVTVLESTTGRRSAFNVGVKDRLKRLRDKPKPNLAMA